MSLSCPVQLVIFVFLNHFRFDEHEQLSQRLNILRFSEYRLANNGYRCCTRGTSVTTWYPSRDHPFHHDHDYVPPRDGMWRTSRVFVVFWSSKFGFGSRNLPKKKKGQSENTSLHFFAQLLPPQTPNYFYRSTNMNMECYYLSLFSKIYLHPALSSPKRPLMG